MIPFLGINTRYSDSRSASEVKTIMSSEQDLPRSGEEHARAHTINANLITCPLFFQDVALHRVLGPLRPPPRRRLHRVPLGRARHQPDTTALL